ncbi:TonB-dependent receptor domain-containing protein [Chitinimonas sp. BJB300]|uniref:TonB-dependent receptor domain-containing protein n=1 Tax=Chitinimonas sp. BJB300 TaxID=1559339 RepID=UPI000C0CB01F|nr:TonB-dependent receptor [Chitinimonas sp. BJB300]PHV09859.1 TonB-dependent receptor [Chitinimonas sp. BJB300]TSJ87406.1 TonB-dependent receptor [Chitinimonas sp. BJB300]
MMQMQFKRKPLSLLCGLALTGSLSAQAGDVQTTETLVITASGFEQKIKQAPASISVITRKELEAQPVNSLSDAVRNVEGISIVGSEPNDTDISIRGLPGEYTLVLVDGKRQGTRETMNRGTGGVQAYLIPPLQAIERIEVVRGPMSSLYGADAMGGVINIITRKHTKQWQGAINVGGTIQGDSKFGNTQQGDFWVGGPIQEGVLGLQIYGNLSDRDEDRIFFPDNFTSGAYGTRNASAAAKLIITPSTAHNVILEVGKNELTYRSTPGKALGAQDDSVRTEHDRQHWSLAHRGKWDFGSSRLAVQQEVGKQLRWMNGERSESTPVITNTVFDALLTLPFESHTLNLGGQYNQNKLNGISVESVVKGHVTSPNGAKTKSTAVFAEDEFAVNDALTLTGGLRIDTADRYSSHWSPRLYAVYKLTDTLTLRGGAAKGFKSPTLRQSELGYCMTTGGGTQKRGSLCGNPNLKPEESLSEEIGIRYDGTEGRSLSFALFNNQFKNKVVSYDSGVSDPLNSALNIYTYDNIDSVQLRGVELGANWPLAKAWRASGNYTYTRSRRHGGGEPAFNGGSLEGRPLDKTPTHVLNAKLEWQPIEALSSYLRVNYLGKQYWAAFRNGAQNVRERSASTTLDLGGSYQINKALSLSAAVLNMTDKIIAVDERGRNNGLDGNWMVDEGRRYWLSLGLKF